MEKKSRAALEAGDKGAAILLTVNINLNLANTLVEKMSVEVNAFWLPRESFFFPFALDTFKNKQKAIG